MLYWANAATASAAASPPARVAILNGFRTLGGMIFSQKKIKTQAAPVKRNVVSFLPSPADDLNLLDGKWLLSNSRRRTKAAVAIPELASQ
jgi:hypothetical protein